MSSLSDEYIDEQIERILRSVGTSMRHYMPSSKEKLRDAMRLILEDSARLLDAASSEAGPMTDTDYDLSIHTNPNARAWASFFMKCNPDSNIPEDVMVTWFANAMMAMHDHMRPYLAPVVLPDGSAIVSGVFDNPSDDHQ